MAIVTLGYWVITLTSQKELTLKDMQDNNFSAFRSGGVRHPPEADIESIRDLLQGYGSYRSILKELIQNAEDAGSTRLDLIYLPGDPAAPHVLLRGPGLLVVNDGVFKSEDRDAITQINLGTKGTEERAIGRFGKGLKSVFAWCEAFFIIAKTDLEQGWPYPMITDLFNPWHGWRHRDWEDEFEVSREQLPVITQEHIVNIYEPGKSWLSFWFPLRNKSVTDTSELSEGWIHESFPGDNPRFFQELVCELQELAPSLVFLRNLKQLAMLNRTTECSDSLLLKFSLQSERIPAPDVQPGTVMSVRGDLVLNSGNGDTSFHYCGFAGRLQEDATTSQLKRSLGWPKVVKRTQGYNQASLPVKGDPHFATLISSHPAKKQGSKGSLELRWCVFFPVGKQPQEGPSVPLETFDHHITINLHGFFFLDSERLRIDGLEDRFKLNEPRGNEVCINWNEFVATQGSLRWLPQSLTDFALNKKLNSEYCRELADALKKTWLWQNFQRAICSENTWQPCWRAGVETWSHISTQNPPLIIPHTDEPEKILKSIPVLGDLSLQHSLVMLEDRGSVPGLHHDKFRSWPEEQVLHLLRSIDPVTNWSETTAIWLIKLLDSVHKDKPLTQTIYQEVSLLRLFHIRDWRKRRGTRINAEVWSDLQKQNQLFAPDLPGKEWLNLLTRCLPDWECFVSYENPEWFRGPAAQPCNSQIAAKIILSQLRFSNFDDCAALVQALTLEKLDSGDEIWLAVRFLLHCESSQARNRDGLFLSESTDIWKRLIEQILTADGKNESWRLLPIEWDSKLNSKNKRDLQISMVDAAGVLKELQSGRVNIDHLKFEPDVWSPSDISKILGGLYHESDDSSSEKESRIKLLRKLRLHTIKGQINERVTVAKSNGDLDESFVLEATDFEKSIPDDLKPQWQLFLNEIKVVERFSDDYPVAARAQKSIFSRKVGSNEEPYLVELDWNYVVRRSLASLKPGDWVELILLALEQKGGQAAKGIGKELKEKKWLPLAQGGFISPDSMIHIEGLEDNLHQLLDPEKDGLAGINHLPEWIRSHRGFASLKTFFLLGEQAIESLGLWLEEKPDWILGLTHSFQMSELKPILEQLQHIETLPVVSFLLKLQSTYLSGKDEKKTENLEKWIEEYILPKVLKPFDYQKDGVEKVKDILLVLQGHKDVKVFEVYLAQAKRDSVLESFLPALSLVNKVEQWIPASKLVWPSENFPPEYQLCQRQADILAVQLNQNEAAAGAFDESGDLPIIQSKGELSQNPNFADQADKLAKYLQPFRNGNIGNNLPCALVAVLAGHEKIKELLKQLLDANLKQHPEDFIAWLLGDKHEDLKRSLEREKFLIDIVRGTSAKAKTITGEEIDVILTQEISTLIVGNPRDLWRSHTFQGRPETACHILRLRWVENPDTLQDPVGVFASTIETILLRVHCNGANHLVPQGIKNLLDRIADAGQADIRRSRSFLLDMAEIRLNELGLKTDRIFEGILKNFNAARQARITAEDLYERNRSISDKKRQESRELLKKANEELVSLMESKENSSRQRLIEALRHKMKDYQYGIDSVTLELFQNADDAVAEWKEMKKTLDSQEQRFVLRFDGQQKVLEIVHWGRPINQHTFPGFEAGSRGYDQDLQKMLALNFSDKGIELDDRPNIVTGRFGLGFKSVFFISDQPEIISARLAFEIRGGFLPMPLSSKVAEEMRTRVPEAGPQPTMIRLKVAESVDLGSVEDSVEKFTHFAPFLSIFSRQIKELTISKNGHETHLRNAEVKLTENGGVTVSHLGSDKSYLCFRCPMRSDDRPATILFQLSPDGIKGVTDEIPRLWITTPTVEKSGLRWVVNAPFKPDAGRKRVAVENTQNQILAKEIAQAWGKSLIELFDKLTANWGLSHKVLKLQENVSSYSWWKQLWQETNRAKSFSCGEQIEQGGQILDWIAWGPDGAIKHLVTHRSAIPTLLPGAYEQLVKLSDLKFFVSGCLSEFKNGCFQQASQWDSFQNGFPASQIVHKTVKDNLSSFKLGPELEKVTLKTVLEKEISPDHLVTPEIGDRFSAILKPLQREFFVNEPKDEEILGLLKWLKELKFLANNDGYYQLNDLICEQKVSDLVSDDEILLSQFALDSAVFSRRYSGKALSFFLQVRGKLEIKVTRIAEWVGKSSDERLQPIFQYLIKSNLDQKLADELGKPWLDRKKKTIAYQRLTQSDKGELDRKFARGQTLPIPQQQVGRIEPVEALKRISEWWRKESRNCLKEFQEKTYPPGFTLNLPWPEEDEWKTPEGISQWLLLFIQGALVPLGFNNMGRDLGFSQFLVSKKWLEALIEIQSDPEKLLRLVDTWLDGAIQNTEFHFQMRQFIAFYASAKHLESLVYSLREANRSESPGVFTQVFSPRTSSSLAGTGIDAPPMISFLGIGNCQILRELFRLGRLVNQNGYPFAFTPFRKVRQLCSSIFEIQDLGSGTQSSSIIFNRLVELSKENGIDPTFDHCFDIPFQFLASNKELQKRVLGDLNVFLSEEDNSLDFEW